MVPPQALKYAQAAEKIREYIRDQGLGPEARLPSERAFGELMNISQATINKAITSLVAEGRLRRDGRKLFVAPPPTDQAPVFVLSHHPEHAEGQYVRHNLLEAANVVCGPNNIKVIPLLARYNEEQFQQLVTLTKDRPGRMAVWPMPGEFARNVLIDLARHGTQMVVCDQDIGPLNYVGIDNHLGCELALQHLYDLGHRQLAYLTYPCANSALQERRISYQYFCHTHGLPRSAGRVAAVANSKTETLAATFAAARRNWPDVTGFFCGNDQIALSMMEVLNREGYDVPGDYSVAGFDNIDAAASSRPGLTTVAQDFYQLGLVTVECLLSARPPVSAPRSPRHIHLEPTLIIRKSTAAPRV